MTYNPQKIVNTMEAVESGTMNVTEASKVFDISRQTLSDRIKRKYTKVGGGRKTKLTEDEEKILVDYCMFMAKCSHPLTVPVVKAFASAIVRKSNQPSRFHPTNGPSWKWWQGFKKRHPEISLRKPDNLNRGRSRMNNQVVMDKFFKLLKEELESIDILNKPEHIFNADETGIDLNTRSGKVIVCKNSKHAYSKQKAPRAHITSMVFCSASGQVLQPMIIFEKNWPSGPIIEIFLMVVYMESHLTGTWIRNFFSHGLKRYLLLEPHMYNQLY